MINHFWIPIKIPGNRRKEEENVSTLKGYLEGSALAVEELAIARWREGCSTVGSSIQ